MQVFELPGGLSLLVGRDLGEPTVCRDVIRRRSAGRSRSSWCSRCSAAWFVTRRVLGRIDDMTATTRQIMDGQPFRAASISGANDELDRLAVNLNAMLDRIEELMAGPARRCPTTSRTTSRRR